MYIFGTWVVKAQELPAAFRCSCFIVGRLQ